jgi:hypothetical protein
VRRFRDSAAAEEAILDVTLAASTQLTMPVQTNYTPIPGGYDSGAGTQVTGTLTFTSQTVPVPNPPPSVR